jgi:hypothetical protein
MAPCQRGEKRHPLLTACESIPAPHPELDFGQFLKLPIREMPQDIEVREFLDGPGRAQDRKKFLPCPKHPQIGHN